MTNCSISDNLSVFTPVLAKDKAWVYPCPSSSTQVYSIDTNPTSAEHEIFNSLAIVFIERSEEHTSELQSRFDLVCRLLLEKKKINVTYLHEKTYYRSEFNTAYLKSNT